MADGARRFREKELEQPRYMRSLRVLDAERQAIKEICECLSGDADFLRQRDAAISLANIAPDSNFARSAIIENGGLAGLVALLSSEHHEPTSEARICACRALAALCQGGYPDQLMDKADVQHQIGKVLNGLPAIVSPLLSVDSTMKPTAEEQHLCAVSADLVTALADGNATNQLAFAEAGILKPIVAMLSAPGQSFTGSNLPAHAAAALAALADHPFLQGTIATHGAIAPLCSLLALGLPTTQQQCALALLRLVRGNLYNKKALVHMRGGVDALIGVLISGGSRDSSFYAGRALVHLATKHPEGAQTIYERMGRVLFCWPNAVDFQVPGDPALHRRKLRGHGILPALGTLVSIPLEPLRACVTYELTPASGGARHGAWDATDKLEPGEHPQPQRP